MHACGLSHSRSSASAGNAQKVACRAAGLPLTSAKCYSAAFTDDVHLGIEEVQRRYAAPL